MPTIKDIAKQAGVSHGTVSNVLNGRDNVSSDKIKRVMDAARAIGYVPNDTAARLRKGVSRTLAVIMPGDNIKPYHNFYSGFLHYAKSAGYSVSRQLSNENNPATEAEAIRTLTSLSPLGVACLSVVAGTSREQEVYPDALPFDNMVFVERAPLLAAPLIAFDYGFAGEEMARRAASSGYRNICLLTGNISFSNEAAFYERFMAGLGDHAPHVTHIQTDLFRQFQNVMQIFNEPAPDAFFISNYSFAESVKDICATFYGKDSVPPIYTTSPYFTIPENDFVKYEMDYRRLGRECAAYLIERSAAAPSARRKRRTDGGKDAPSPVYLESHGFRQWEPQILPVRHATVLNVITIDAPEAYTMKNMARLFTQKTGIELNIGIFSYDEIYEVFNSLRASSGYDILRIDVTWLSWFAKKLLLPLTSIDPSIDAENMGFLPGTPAQYGLIGDELYALPVTPSAQMLFYRRDLFEDPINRRMYYETHKKELEPPADFEEFLRISSFFTQSINPLSPTEYGATMTLGSTGVAASEYLARLFSRQLNLYDENGEVHLDNQASLQSLSDMVRLTPCTSPSYCTWWTDTAESFASGRYAMSILYSNYAGDLLSHSSRVVGNIGYSMIPGNNPVIGGGSLGVCKYSRHPEEALSFIRWITSEPVSSAAAYLGSTSPCSYTYENEAIVDNFPWMHLTKSCFTSDGGRRVPPHLHFPFDERKFLNIIGIAVKCAIAGIQTPEEALAAAQEAFTAGFPYPRG